MKKFALLVVSLFAAGSALYARKPAPVIPDFIHAAYSVESLLSEAELTNPGYDAFQFIYLMATPEWAGLDFDRPQDAVDAYATQFDYLKQGGKMALAPSMIEKAKCTLPEGKSCSASAGSRSSFPCWRIRIGSPGLSGIWCAWSKRTVTTASTWTGRSRWTRSCMPA